MEPPSEPPAASLRLTVPDLLRLRHPTTSASSLLSSSPSLSTSTSPSRKKPKLPSPGPAASTVPFAPIPHPVLLAGTLSLSSPLPDACRNHCLSLSDPSSATSVYCYLLDFDPAAISRKILVLAWNYLPSMHHRGAGVLEVVRWCLAEAPRASFLATIPLNCVDTEPDLATHGHVFGVKMSVSVVLSVPHAMEKSKADGGGDHKFEVENFVCFVDSASRWRPVLGRLVSISGLMKKMVSVGKKGSYTMLVSSTKTMVAWCNPMWAFHHWISCQGSAVECTVGSSLEFTCRTCWLSWMEPRGC